jgi:hypothetical protein
LIFSVLQLSFFNQIKSRVCAAQPKESGRSKSSSLFNDVIPAQAGIQKYLSIKGCQRLDSRLRENDEDELASNY